MANIKSQMKRNRQNERRRLRNKGVKAELRTRVKSAVAAVTEDLDDAKNAIQLAMRKLDKAASAGVIHKNQAANRKSKLAKRLARLSTKA